MQQSKWNKIFFCIYYTKKTEFIPTSEIKCPKSGIFTKGCGESGKVFCKLAWQFFGRCQKIFRAKMAQPPRKSGPYAYEKYHQCDDWRTSDVIAVQRWWRHLLVGDLSPCRASPGMNLVRATSSPQIATHVVYHDHVTESSNALSAVYNNMQNILTQTLSWCLQKPAVSLL